ncbi:kinase domain-containing protein [Favolaschia claudopus]|uniref:Kinase domain-containing protein n=1 Tax=Favolaschia claudopus TaxID=2862362 RepID=A0AAW0AKU8_9AGAR
MEELKHDIESSLKTPHTISDFSEQVAQESGRDIQYRTCSWQKAACLLFSAYVCLAILAFPWSYAILGLVPGVLVTICVAASVQYTSLILWRFCMEHPEVRSVCDIGRIIFGGQWGYTATAVGFILNNTFIQALECLAGAKLLNTLVASGGFCTVGYSAIVAIICFVLSLPRTLNQLSGLATFSAVTMGISVLLAVIFSGIQSEPFGYIEGEAPLVTAFPVSGTTYVSGMLAFLNITHALIGQTTIPSFLAEMKNPKDFPKALWAATIGEVVSVYFLVIGNQYVTSPAYGSLQPVYKKIAFCFAIPSIIYLGSLYASVSARFIFLRIFDADSKHTHSNTLIGWGTWIGIIAVTWVFAFILAEIIPFFPQMISTICSLFNGWFGFIYWAMAYMMLYPGKSKWAGPKRSLETLFNYFLIVFGLYILIAGTYVSVQSIIDSYHASEVGTVFSCASNAI